MVDAKEFLTQFTKDLIANPAHRMEMIAGWAKHMEARELEIARRELQPIHTLVQKPSNYGEMKTIEQTLWVVKALGKIGTYCDDRKVTLDAIGAKL